MQNGVARSRTDVSAAPVAASRWLPSMRENKTPAVTLKSTVAVWKNCTARRSLVFLDRLTADATRNPCANFTALNAFPCWTLVYNLDYAQNGPAERLSRPVGALVIE